MNLTIQSVRYKVLNLSFSSKVLILWLLAISMLSCASKDQHEKSPAVSEKAVKEELFEANRKAVKAEDRQIRDFINRQKWNVRETGSGLYYVIYERGDGARASDGKIAMIDFTVSLLNGTEIYSSKNSGPKEFVIGRGGVESGLEEGILLMHVGDRAKFILPSHLAYGLLGDEDKIPPKSTIIYDVKLLELK